MASFSSLPAMDIDPVGFGARDSALQSTSQIDYLNAQKAQANQDLATQAQAAQLQETIANAPLDVKAKQQQSQLQSYANGREIVSNTIQAAQAAEAAGESPADVAQIWDQGMSQAKETGYAPAAQYVGHYQIGLAERLGDVYGPQAGGKAATAAAAREQAIDQGQIDRAVAAMPMQQAQSVYARQNLVLSAWDKIKTGGKAAWDEEMANMKAAGIDPVKDGHLDSLEYSTLNYAKAAKVIQNITPFHDALARRMQLQATGATPPAPAPLGTQQYIGTTPQGSLPVTMNTVTGEEKVGNQAVGPKPTAAISAFQYKEQAAIRAGMSPVDALQFANGRKQLPDERIRDMALSEANKELGDATLAGANIPDPDGWVRAKAAENYRLLTQGAPGAGGGGGQSGPTTPNKVTLPPRVMSQLQQAGGRPLTFKNGQTWKLVNGRPVRVS